MTIPAAAPRQELSREEFARFQRLLHETCGLHFDFGHHERLRAGLLEGLSVHKLESFLNYYDFLTTHPQGPKELAALLDRLTVGETYFFRNRPQFEILREHLLPALARTRTGAARTLTVWSAGCATGEEPYSIAILLLETLPEPSTWGISILATDLNRDYLRRAREGVYATRAVRQVPDHWLRRYFTMQEGRYALREEVTRLVHFAQHNLIADALDFPGMRDVDLLFCRNVTIYFTLETTRRVIDRLAGTLREDGHLFIGDAETLWQISDRVEPAEFPQTVIYRKTGASAARPAVAPAHFKPPVLMPSFPLPVPPDWSPPSLEPSTVSQRQEERSESAEAAYAQGVEAARHKDREGALMHFTQTLRLNPGHQAARLGLASLLADAGRDAEALAALREIVDRDNLAGPAYYLLGALAYRAKRYDEALEAFRRAVYAEPTLVLAYVERAGVYRALGQRAMAVRELQNAMRLLEGAPEEEPVRLSEDLTCGYLRIACARQLEGLTNGATEPVRSWR